VIDKIERVYKPIAHFHHAELKIERNWESGTVNAGTFRDENGKHWHINLYGGLARHALMTADDYALVICHEIGHHIGGAPKKIINESRHWSSTEGQADYWATLKCLRRVFYKEDNIGAIDGSLQSPQLTLKCQQSFSSEQVRSLCIRLALASEVLAKISAVVRNVPMPRFETPDTAIAQETYDKHPVPQCRLDSFFQGSLCPLSYENPVSQQDEFTGVCHSESSYLTGIRPRCWYAGK